MPIYTQTTIIFIYDLSGRPFYAGDIEVHKGVAAWVNLLRLLKGGVFTRISEAEDCNPELHIP